MNLTEFRQLHSELIEHYQHIEYHLECIYSTLQESKTLLEGLHDVEKDNIIKLVERVCASQKKNGVFILTEDDCEKIRKVSQERNLWCHDCYVKLAFDRKTGGLKYRKDIDRLMYDLKEAKQLRDYLFEKKLPGINEKFRQEYDYS